jgi:hypothetical protein
MSYFILKIPFEKYLYSPNRMPLFCHRAKEFRGWVLVRRQNVWKPASDNVK